MIGSIVTRIKGKIVNLLSDYNGGYVKINLCCILISLSLKKDGFDE